MDVYNETGTCDATFLGFALSYATQNIFTTIIISTAVIKITSVALRCLFPRSETKEQKLTRFRKQFSDMREKLRKADKIKVFSQVGVLFEGAVNLWVRYEKSGIIIEDSEDFRNLLCTTMEGILNRYADGTKTFVRTFNGTTTFDLKTDGYKVITFKVCVKTALKLAMLSKKFLRNKDESAIETYADRIKSDQSRFLRGPNTQAVKCYNTY